MTFDPANYDTLITLAAGDFGTCFPSESPSVSGRTLEEALDAGVIEKTATAFVECGASILIAPTDDIVLDPTRALNDPVAESADPSLVLMRCIVQAVRSGASRAPAPAAGAGPMAILGAIGPVDQLLTLGEIEEAVLLSHYAGQAKALAEGGADGVLCRGFTELEALLVAINAIRKTTSLPVVGSMIFDSGHDYSQTSMAVTIPQAAQGLLEAGAVMIGCDDSAFPDGAPAFVSLARASSLLPVYVEINAGRPELTETGLRYPEAPKTFGERLERLVDAGATIISGGAGATPPHLAEMAKAAGRLRRRRAPGPTGAGPSSGRES